LKSTDRAIFLPRKRKKRFGSATILRFVSETRSAKRYFVSGMVQGVGFRFYTQRIAEKQRVSGFVRNLRDGRVEVFAIGTVEQHKELRRLLERGPLGSDVTEVLEEPAPVETQYDGSFVINPTA
jgi:acylphosphatase